MVHPNVLQGGTDLSAIAHRVVLHGHHWVGVAERQLDGGNGNPLLSEVGRHARTEVMNA